jgi:MarR family 2-MHQ and catechol resistance regulon transcriptional repressor
MAVGQELALKLHVVLTRATNAIQRHAEADMARHGLSPGEFGIMEALYHKGPLLLGEVQRKILVSSGGVTYLVDRLHEQGLVERRECETDRRARYAVLTKKGEQLMAEIFPEHAASLERALAGLTDEEKEQALSLLRKLGHYAASLPAERPHARS